MALALITIALLCVATCSAVWASHGAVEPFRRTLLLKAALAATFAGLQIADLFTFDLPTWVTIARTFQTAAIVLVWILPDVAAKRGRARIIGNIDRLAVEATQGHDVTDEGTA
jgi:hypothetical protein